MDAENPIYGDLKPPKKRNAQRAGNRRPGRPRGTGKKREGIKQRKNCGIFVFNFFFTDHPSNEPSQPKRGPGRPKTKQPGPSNQGYRNIPLQRMTSMKFSEGP